MDPMASSTTSTSSSYIIADPSVSTGTHPSDDDNDDVASLPSISSGILDSEADSSDAQREWEQSLEQLQLLLTMIIMPFAGKYLGRKFAYWSWARYMEWLHNVEVRWTSKGAFAAAGVAEAAASL